MRALQVFPLLAAAAAVGILHMSAPDHWVTICILGQRALWSRSRLLLFGTSAAGGHVVLSLALGLAIVVLGFVFSKALSTYLTLGTGAVMLVAGLAYGLRTLLQEEPEDYDREAAEDMAKMNAAGKGMGYFAVLGGALSPDLSILPVLLIASQGLVGLVADTAIVFAAASMLTMLSLVVAGSIGLARALSRAPAKYNDALVGFVIAAVGAFVIVFG